MLLAVASPPPRPGLALLLSSLFRDELPGDRGGGGGGDVCFWGLPPALGEKVPLRYGNNELH